MKPFKPSNQSESRTAEARRASEGWFDKYLAVERVLDVGCGSTPVVAYAIPYDIANGSGDASHLANIADESFQAVHASHVLEHLAMPRIALRNWWRVLEPGGFLLISVPEEDSYERGAWPSIQNSDHKTTWCAWTSESWSPHSYSLLQLLGELPSSKLHSVRLVQDNDKYASVEAVVEKRAYHIQHHNTTAANVVCMCGSISMLFMGTNVVGMMKFSCLNCGQTTHFSLLEHAKQAAEASQRWQAVHEPGSTVQSRHSRDVRVR